jgi:hypothetical protein
MKNVHLLPTDKPSRLAGSEYITNEQGIDKRVFKFKLWDKLIPNKDLKDIGYIPQNIYITSDEEIKDVRPHKGKWQLEQEQILNKFPTYLTDLSECKLVIMTTDPDLIEDGVQAIDDEFLEWFVKNPSCESIKVVHKFDEDWSEESGAFEISYYKIIIPKEEPKQIKCYCGHTITCDCEPLQETLEEASLRIGLMEIELNHTKTLLASCEKALENRDNQAKRMYSEEDLKLILQLFVKDTRGNSPWVDADDEWFEQFKKKQNEKDFN